MSVSCVPCTSGSRQLILCLVSLPLSRAEFWPSKKQLLERHARVALNGACPWRQPSPKHQWWRLTLFGGQPRSLAWIRASLGSAIGETAPVFYSPARPSRLEDFHFFHPAWADAGLHFTNN